MADPDAASAALIAQLMCEENPYCDGDGDYGGSKDDSDDEDYGKGG
jgi:hypothetical protein